MRQSVRRNRIQIRLGFVLAVQKGRPTCSISVAQVTKTWGQTGRTPFSIVKRPALSQVVRARPIRVGVLFARDYHHRSAGHPYVVFGRSHGLVSSLPLYGTNKIVTFEAAPLPIRAANRTSLGAGEDVHQHPFIRKARGAALPSFLVNRVFSTLRLHINRLLT